MNADVMVRRCREFPGDRMMRFHSETEVDLKAEKCLKEVIDLSLCGRVQE